MNNLEILEGTILEEYNQELGELTLKDPKYDWTEKLIDGVGEVEE